jgi:hypothetical protein
LKRILIFLFIVTLAQTSVFTFYNRLLGKSSEPDSVHPQEQVQQQEQAASAQPIQEEPKELKENQLLFDGEVRHASLSDSGQMAAYTDSQNTLHIKDLTADKEVYSLASNEPVEYISWIQDNGLLIGTSKDNGGSKELTLKTVMLSNKSVRTIRKIAPVTDSSTFKEITFSPYTNDIYILIGNEQISRLYHIGTNGDFKPMEISSYYIDKVAMSSTKNELFFQDIKDKIPYLHAKEEKETKRIQQNAVILRSIEDMLYYGTLDASGNVTAVYSYVNGNSKKVAGLSEPAKPNHLFVKEDGTVIQLKEDRYKNVKTGKEAPFPISGKAVVRNNGVFLLSPEKTMLLAIR